MKPLPDRSPGRSRRGSILIIAAGIAAIVAALALACVSRVRADAEEVHAFLQDVQSRVMLTAALQYVQETARLGWDDPAPSGRFADDFEHEEAFGWIDVRDGQAGPRLRDGRWPAGIALSDGLGNGPAFPAAGGRAARCPMHPLRRPPFAVRPATVGNAIRSDDLSLAWKDLVGYQRPDPERIGTWSEFIAGDRRPDPAMEGRAWFRVRRHRIVATDSDDPTTWTSPARFLITCGAGASLGYRDWDEVVADGATAIFGSRDVFDDIRRHESIQWYEAEWSPAVDAHRFYRHMWQSCYRMTNIDAVSRPTYNGWYGFSHWQGGTFAYIQRIFAEPSEW
ncbi:MAG TPA: hypothetical protein VEL07_02380 [Planctomycetota bacterium]|nr:hypothetical protein [Planctomycetota bacterium]